jgi:hypothetical protein
MSRKKWREVDVEALARYVVASVFLAGDRLPDAWKYQVL